MSGETLAAKELNREIRSHKYSKLNKSRVDINDLLHRVRLEKNKERKENYLFLGIICVVVAATGIIASF